MYMYYTSKLRKSIHQLHCVAVGSVLSICVSLDTWTVVWLHDCAESSYWRFKKWVHVIDHKQSYISKDVEEMLRVHGREGFGGEGGGGQKYFCITVVQHVQSYVSLSLIIIKRAFFYLSKLHQRSMHLAYA